MGINPRINLKDLPLEGPNDLEILPQMDVTDTAPFPTGGYNRYRTTFPGKIHYHRRRGRAHSQGAASEPRNNSVCKIHRARTG